MAIFIDSSDLREIEKYHSMGIIGGVTTNPTIMVKDGVVGGLQGIKQHSKEISALVAPLPVSVEVLSNEPATMIDQAREFSSWASNIVVKITIHGPNGETQNLSVVHELETTHDIRVNVTAMMSAQQCYLAALAGATYVSMFCGRVNNMGYNAIDEIAKTRKLLDGSGLGALIVAGSTREVLNVVEWLIAGAHIVTVVPKLIEGMIIHPYSKETVQMFLADSERLLGTAD